MFVFLNATAVGGMTFAVVTREHPAADLVVHTELVNVPIAQSVG
jgi:hypothetical protein